MYVTIVTIVYRRNGFNGFYSYGSFGKTFFFFKISTDFLNKKTTLISYISRPKTNIITIISIENTNKNFK